MEGIIIINDSVLHHTMGDLLRGQTIFAGTVITPFG
jgi:hypothetical protein